MGDPNVNTPNIDRLANDGFNATNAISGCPLWLLGARHASYRKYPHNCVPVMISIPPDQPTIAHVFKENGYHTGLVCKWHLDGFKERTGRAGVPSNPRERRGGFDDWVGSKTTTASGTASFTVISTGTTFRCSVSPIMKPTISPTISSIT